MLTEIYVAEWAAAYLSTKSIFPTNSELHLQQESEIFNTGNETKRK